MIFFSVSSTFTVENGFLMNGDEVMGKLNRHGRNHGRACQKACPMGAN